MRSARIGLAINPWARWPRRVQSFELPREEFIDPAMADRRIEVGDVGREVVDRVSVRLRVGPDAATDHAAVAVGRGPEPRVEEVAEELDLDSPQWSRDVDDLAAFAGLCRVDQDQFLIERLGVPGDGFQATDGDPEDVGKLPDGRDVQHHSPVLR